MSRQVSHPDFAAPVVYDAVPLPEDSGDNQVAATISIMRRLAREDSRSSGMQRLAAKLISLCNSPDDYVAAVFHEAKRRMYFQQDADTAGPIGDAVELLIRPAYVIEMFDSTGQRVPGDCDCFSMFVASLLLAGGVDCSFATASTMRNEPGEFSHVYVIAFPQTNQRIVIDASHGSQVGWEAPNFGRYMEWPVNGGVSSCAEFVLLALVFIAGAFFKWGGSSSQRSYAEAA